MLELVQAVQLRQAVEAEVELRDLVQHRHNDERRDGGPRRDDDASVELDPQQAPGGGGLLAVLGVEDTDGSLAAVPHAGPGLGPEGDGEGADQARPAVDGDGRDDVVDLGRVDGDLDAAPDHRADRPDEVRGAVAEPDAPGRHGDEAAEDPVRQALRVDVLPSRADQEEEGLVQEAGGAATHGAQGGVHEHLPRDVRAAAQLDAGDTTRNEAVPADPQEEDAPDHGDGIPHRLDRRIARERDVVLRICGSPENVLDHPRRTRGVVQESPDPRPEHDARDQR
mmetsp:Transcript_29322/g.87196  ORF Transcript_29322/g.87196 Transcript_29322/m.87196 type:complete len:281 (-) Transcript_29322:86-928(-)